MAIDWTKPVVDLEGKSYRVGESYIDERGRDIRIVFAKDGKGEAAERRNNADGTDVSYLPNHKKAIINVPPKPVIVEIGEVWVNVYETKSGRRLTGASYASEKIAREMASPSGGEMYLGPAKLPPQLEMFPHAS